MRGRRATVARAVGLAVALVAAAVLPSIEALGRGWIGRELAPSWRGMRIPGGFDPMAEARRSLGGVGAAVPPGAIVALVVEQNASQFARDDRAVQRYFAAGHVLAPAVLRRVHLPDCVARGVRGCGLSEARFALLRKPVSPLAMDLVTRAGLGVIRDGPEVVLLGGAAP